jgi:glutamate synthase domain-containing protein 1
MERVAAKLGHDSFTWRTVPTNNRSLGKSAVAVEPIVEQWFLSSRGIKEALDTEQQVGGLPLHAYACVHWCWRFLSLSFSSGSPAARHQGGT